LIFATDRQRSKAVACACFGMNKPDADTALDAEFVFPVLSPFFFVYFFKIWQRQESFALLSAARMTGTPATAPAAAGLSRCVPGDDG
jgi:hypothetical protein